MCLCKHVIDIYEQFIVCNVFILYVIIVYSRAVSGYIVQIVIKAWNFVYW